MKNLKKTLCLVLALVMVLGCMVVNAGAATYDDQNEIEHTEAVAVLSALGVLEGDGTNFNPTETLTRAQGAAIIARMLLGPEAADDLTATGTIFTDVSGWSAGYISYCASEGILDGVGGGKFNPNGTLTMSQFAKMLLCALGYDSDYEGYTGTGWEMNVVGDGILIDLFDGIDGAYTVDCTRDAAAQLALNTLKATMVYYSSGAIKVESGDSVITVGGSSATKEDAIESTDGNIGGTADGYLQFAEYYFQNLKYKTTADADFGRPAGFSWTWKGETVYTGADDTDLLATYVGKVSTGDLYTLIGKTAYAALKEDPNLFTVVKDGEVDEAAAVVDYFVKNNSGKKAGNGVITEVYMDDYYNVTIVHINTYLAVAADDYDADDETLKIEVYGHGSVDTETIYADDVNGDLTGYVEDDWMLVTIDGEEVYSVTPAETVTGTISTYTVDSSVTVGGSKYQYSEKYDEEEFGAQGGYTIGSDIILVLDTYGYVIGNDSVSSSSAYVYISKFANTSNLGTNYQAAAFFPDGTYDEINIKSVDGQTSMNTDNNEDTAWDANDTGWYKYSINSAGKYVLTSVAANRVADVFDADKYENGDLTITNESIKASIKLTNSTKFVVYDSTDGDLDTYTGYSNLPTIEGGIADVYAVNNSYGYATYVFIDTHGASVRGGSSEDYLYVYKITGNGLEVTMDEDENLFYNHKYTLLNGEETKVKSNYMLAVGLYTNLVYDEYGYLDDYDVVYDQTNDTYNVTDDVNVVDYAYTDDGYITYTSGVISFGNDSFALADDYQIFVIGGDDDYDTLTATKLAKLTRERNNSDYIVDGTVVVVLNSDDEAQTIYLTYKRNPNLATNEE